MQVAGVQMPDFGSFGAAGALWQVQWQQEAQGNNNAWQILARQRKAAPINSDKIVVSPLVGTFTAPSSQRQRAL